MNCRRVKEEFVMLFGQQDEGRSLLVAMQRHVRACPHCHERAESTQRIVSILRRRCGQAPTPKGLRTRIVAGLRQSLGRH